jgi:hypothetical protein
MKTDLLTVVAQHTTRVQQAIHCEPEATVLVFMYTEADLAVERY